MIALDIILEYSTGIDFTYNSESIVSGCETIYEGTSRCIILTDQSGEVLTASAPFEIIDITAAKQGGYVTVTLSEVPVDFIVGHAYPNPFNPVVKFDYTLPIASEIAIKIYDISGRQVTVLMNNILESGHYSLEWNADQYPSGIYFVKFNINGALETRKVILMK